MADDDLITPSDYQLRAAERVRQAWPGRQLSDAQLGLAPSRRAGLGDAGLPAGYVVDRAPRSAGPPPGYVIDRPPRKQELPDAPWVQRGAAGGFDPDQYLRDTANRPAPSSTAFNPDAYLASLPDAPWVTQQPSIAGDVAKSAGIGIAKGLIGIPAAPGNIQSLIERYNPFDYLTRKYEQAYPEQAAKNRAAYERLHPLGDVPGEVRFPTSADIQQPIESVTGQFYEPQTTAGKYAESIGEFAPAMLAGPGNLAERAMWRAVIPGTASEAAGEATQGTALEPWARLAAGATGLAGGELALRAAPRAVPTVAGQVRPAAPAVDMAALERDITGVSPEGLPVATPRGDLGIRLLHPETPHDLAPRGRASVGAAATEASPLADYSAPTIERARELLADSGLDNPYRLEAALDETSPHHTFAELSPALEKEVAGIAAADKGQAKNLIAQTFLERAKEAPQRMAAAFDRAFGPPQNLSELQRAIEAERAKTATPLWRQFTQTTAQPTPALRALLPRLDAAGALRAANKAMREEGLPVQQGFARAITDEAGEWAEQVEHMPTAAAFQYAKEHLDGLIEKSLASPGEAKAARRYTALKNDLIAAIDKHPDPQVAGVWQAARRAWQQPTELLEAQNLGRRLLTGNVDREDLPGLVAGWSPERMNHLTIGIRNYLEDLEKGNRSAARTSNRLLDAVLAPGNQDKLRAVLGDARADQLIEAIRHEESMHGAPNRIIGGSPTADRTAARNRYLPGEGIIDKLSVEQLMHPGRAIGKGLAKAGLNRFAKQREAAAAQLRDELSRIMTTQGAERNAIARALIGAEEPEPSRWARPGGIVPPQAPAAAATAGARPQAVWSEGGWRPVSADDLAQMQEAARQRQAAQRPQRVPAGPRSMSLLQFLASRGGVKPTGDLRHTLDKNPVVPGYGRLLRPGGMTEEDAMTAAVEAGYLGTEQGIRGRGNIRDFHNAVHEEAHRRKRYPIGEERAVPVDVEAFRHSEAQDILHALEQVGAHIPDDRVGDRIVDLVRNHGMHPEMAHERAIMEGSNVGQDEGLPALPAQAAARFSDDTNATSSARVQAQPNQGQSAGAGAGSSTLLPGQAYPATPERGLGSHSVAIRQVAAVGEANRLGLMPRIQQLALHGKTDAEIAMAIGGQLSSTDVRLVRHHLGIGPTSELRGGDDIPFARGGGVGFAAGGADDETLRADLEAAGLKCSPRAAGGRVDRARVPGELDSANKATHEEAGYVDKSPFPKKMCSLCSKYIPRIEGGPACKKIASPIRMGGYCRRFVRNTTFTTEELRDAVNAAVARGESRDAILKRMRERGLSIPAGV
jgi:hypothetical protein